MFLLSVIVRKFSSRRAWIVGLGLAATASVGCGGEKHLIVIDPAFSRNVIKAPDWFPENEWRMTQAEQTVLFRLGRPDVLRLWWHADGSLISSSDLTFQHEDEIVKKIARMDKSWIYMRDKQEVTFSRNGRDYEVKALSEPMELVCEHGDPSFRTPPTEIDGIMREKWTWIDAGVQVDIADGKVVNKQFFKGTGQGTWAMR